MTHSPFSLDRRTLLLALPAWPAASLIPRALGATPPALPIPAQPLQTLIDRAAAAGGAIVVPPGPPLAVTAPVRVPDDATLVVQRDLAGSGGAALLLNGRTTLRFERAKVTDVTIRPLAGAIAVTGLDYSGHRQLAAVLIAGPGPYTDLRIRDFRIADANFGILRQGASSSLTGATIANGTFRNLAGDAIEWNVCPHDSGVVIENHDIRGIDAPAGKPFWGIGVGVAGASYTPGWDPAVSAKGFAIRNITGRSLAQLVHVEAGVDFSIEHVFGQDISARYSRASGIETAAVVCYGCRGFTIADVRADARVMIASGVRGSRYVVPCSDLVIEDVDLSAGDLQIEVGGKASTMRLERIRLRAGALSIRGAAHDLTMARVSVTSGNAAQPPFASNPTFLSGPLAAFRPDRPTVRQRDVRFARGR